MKRIVKYQSNDGALFDTINAAMARDRLMIRCDELEALLPRRPTKSSDRVRHDPVTLVNYKRAVVLLCRDEFPDESTFHKPAEDLNPNGYAGRVVSEIAPPCVNRLWGRLACIDEDGYEYQQPFYAMHVDVWTAEYAGAR